MRRLKRKKVKCNFSLLTFFFFFSTVLVSQSYLVHHYTEMDGLPVLPFYGIQKDQRGRIWASSDVLLKGPVVVYLDQPGENDRPQWHRVQGHSPGITGVKSVKITSFQLLELKEEKADLPAVAVGTSTLGLFLWHRGEWKNLNEKKGLLSNSVNGIATLGGIRKSARHIVTAADRGAELVRQILTFSRQSKRERKPIKLKTIIKDSLSLMRSILPATIEIRQDIQASSHYVLADSTQIRQVMLNFGTNAAHAMRETGGTLGITLEEAYLDAETVKRYNDIDAGLYLKLTVSDTGHGMSPEVMKRIFDPYFTTKKTGEGTGMGLAVIHGIVKGHGGDISVQSQSEKGTTFQVLLPCIVDTEKEQTGKILISEEIPGGSERILLVDDEIRLLDAISQILGKKDIK
jgi:hypothetical protein